VNEEVVKGRVKVLASDPDDLLDRKSANTDGPGLVTPKAAGEECVG